MQITANNNAKVKTLKKTENFIIFIFIRFSQSHAHTRYTTLEITFF
jgi:hypothetical protein